MDADRFDRLARALVRQHSRRGLAALLGGLAVAGSVGLPWLEVSAGRKRRKRSRKRQDDAIPSADTQCAGTFLFCDGACIDASTNDSHCGACGQTCGPCHFCQGGRCCFAATGPCTIGGLPGQCLNGTCNPKPNCLPRGTQQCHLTWPYTCCGAGICTVFSNATTACLHKGDVGSLCHSGDDCTSGLCYGYRCTLGPPLGDVTCGGSSGIGTG